MGVDGVDLLEERNESVLEVHALGQFHDLAPGGVLGAVDGAHEKELRRRVSPRFQPLLVGRDGLVGDLFDHVQGLVPGLDQLVPQDLAAAAGLSGKVLGNKRNVIHIEFLPVAHAVDVEPRMEEHRAFRRIKLLFELRPAEGALAGKERDPAFGHLLPVGVEEPEKNVDAAVDLVVALDPRGKTIPHRGIHEGKGGKGDLLFGPEPGDADAPGAIPPDALFPEMGAGDLEIPPHHPARGPVALGRGRLEGAVEDQFGPGEACREGGGRRRGLPVHFHPDAQGRLSCGDAPEKGVAAPDVGHLVDVAF